MNLQEEIEKYEREHPVIPQKIMNDHISVIAVQGFPNNAILLINPKSGKPVAVIRNIGKRARDTLKNRA